MTAKRIDIDIIKLLLLLSYWLILIRIYPTEAYANVVDARIVGGRPTIIQQASFVVSIRRNGKFICGGSLIRAQYVVTAAHCVKGVSPSQLTVVGGATLLSDIGSRRSVIKITLPKDYTARTYNKDVAVLKLNRQLNGTNIKTIGLCQKTWKAGDHVDVYGWGQTSEKSTLDSNSLRTVSVPLISYKRCVSLYKNKATLTNTMFCAGDLRSKDACSGDSGGPVVYNGQLCGIVSWGIGCAQSHYPGVYTNVRMVRSFITRAIS